MPNPFSPRLSARFVQGGAALQQFLRPSAGNRGGVGKLPSSVSEALTLINARCNDGDEPLTEEDVYIHYLEAANNAFVSDRFCFIGESTLKNIATDAAAGFAFMNSHRTGGYWSPSELPLGATFCGRFERVSSSSDDDQTDQTDQTDDSAENQASDAGSTRDDGSNQRRAVVGVYLLKGVAPNGGNGISTDDMHRSIKARTIFDCSVGIYGGQQVCDVCGHGLYELDEEYRYLCAHYPGSVYNMTEEQITAQLAKGVTDGRCSYSWEDANCNEVSAVYDGACPGAGFVKMALSPLATDAALAPLRDDLLSKLSAGYGTPFTVTDLGKLREQFQLGTGGALPAVPKPEIPKPPTTRHSPTAENTGTKDKKPMKLNKAALRALFGLGENDPIEIEDGAPVANPAPAPANPQVETALSTLTDQVTALAATATAQNATITALTEQLAAGQKTAEESAKVAQLAAAKTRINAAKKAFLITPAAAKDMEKLAEESPAAFNLAMGAFEKNGQVVTVAGIPGFSQEPPTGTSGEELLGDDPAEIASTIATLAKKKMATNPKMAYHDATLEVLRERPDLGNAYESTRIVAGGK
ncbi:hypothetical protein [Armatimonas sp.]|uniref:hypothetical protein n=1 Tax=Armatimonas sp. TaxID=1872638 RepID=UPI00374D75CA